jgi:hypothetical protein
LFAIHTQREAQRVQKPPPVALLIIDFYVCAEAPVQAEPELQAEVYTLLAELTYLLPEDDVKDPVLEEHTQQEAHQRLTLPDEGAAMVLATKLLDLGQAQSSQIEARLRRGTHCTQRGVLLHAVSGVGEALCRQKADYLFIPQVCVAQCQ